MEQLLDNLTRTQAIKYLVDNGFDKKKVSKLSDDQLVTAYDVQKRKMKNINKTLLKELKELSNQQLLTTAQAYKIESRSNYSTSFDKNYNTVLYEVETRGLLK